MNVGTTKRKDMKYIKNSTVVAVQINLTLSGGKLHYEKWGGQQEASEGDWLIDNNGEAYTCEQKVFASTYEQVSPGVYRKTATIEAEQATEDGAIDTLEGSSKYKAGDFLVTNPGGDRYPIEHDKFVAMYEPV